MRRTTPQSVGNILSTDPGGLQRLLNRAKALQRINLTLQAYLPSPLNRHTRLANVAGGIVILQVDSAAWHTRLRYQAPQILAFLRSNAGLENLREIRIRVRPSGEPPKAPSQPARMSADAATVIGELAKTTTHPALRAALQRLSSRHQR